MRVYFDYQIFARQRRGGVSRAYVELCNEFLLDRSLGVSPVFNYQLSRNDYAHVFGSRKFISIREGGILDRSRICEKPSLAAHRFAPVRADIHHLTYYDRRALSRGRSIPVVSTLIDFIPERMPARLVQNRSAHLDKMEVLERSDLIICISESVRVELEEIAPALAARAVTVPLGTRPLERQPHADRKDNFLLYVGSRGGYKRFDVLLEAMRFIGDREVTLFCAGGGRFTAKEMDTLATLSPNITATQSDLSDNELDHLYREATVLISTSAAEGFGLPALEAMGFGCPVVLTDIPVYRETSAGSAVLVSAGAPEELGAAIASLLDRPQELTRLGLCAWERSSQLTWAKTARLTAAAYRSIV